MSDMIEIVGGMHDGVTRPVDGEPEIVELPAQSLGPWQQAPSVRYRRTSPPRKSAQGHVIYQPCKPGAL